MHAGRGERPRRRLRVVTAVVGVLAAVAAAVVALTVGGDPTGGPAGTPTVTRPTAAAAAPPLRVEDPLTLDPCSLLDTASLRAHGDARVDRHDITFAACGADLTRPDGSSVMVTTQFRAASELVLPSGAARESLDGRGVYRLPVEPDGSCGRRIMLTESTAAEVWALPGGEGATGDLCAIAETATRAAVATVADGVIGARPGMDTTTVLGGTDACGLLQPADLAVVPGMRQPVAGFGNWACWWSDGEPTPTEVHVTFYLGKPLGDSDGVPADLAGHPGRVLAGEGDCWVQFVQRDYTADSSPRIESVWVRVYGPRPGTQLCGTATALATAAASRLPPPS